MIASEILEKGVERGIITAEQAERLRALETAGEPPELPASPDDEQLRFISGFSDIFVTIGLALFIGATGYFGSRSGGPLGMWITIAIMAWLLAEFFTRLRRMALPSIVLLVVFAAAVFLGTNTFFGTDARANIHLQTPAGMLGLNGYEPTMVAAAAFVTVLATAVHYWRFRVPITIAAGCCALTGTVVGLVHGLTPELPPVAYNVVIFACGLAVFALAMRFDIADPERLTRRTDVAFWLHLLASPLIVHSLIKGMVTDASKLSPGTAVAIMAVFLALSFVAVLIDRRALLVSGLAYAGVAFWTLIRQVGLSDMTTPLTLLVLGAFVLLLSAGWKPLRAGILKLTPLALTRRLPQPTLSV
ncbi:hypothetical protein [Bradyrhizobium sp. AZCC 1693]|uniref:hypothetical protein n=1 Tax=Bradyrhizobium sp. AZCC 1693 TaxID=3117029 RepID=UPI002FF00F20